MEQSDRQFSQVLLASRSALPSLRFAVAVLLLSAGIAVLLEWGEGSQSPYSANPNLPPFRYVNSGWISPLDWEEAGPFATELRAYVLTSQEELDDLESEFISKRSYGNSTSLGRIEFADSVLLAAYYVWRPARGDPLSVADLMIYGNRAEVKIELDEEPQGREYPYLFAPMIMVAVERALFPQGEAVEFVFELDGHPSITLAATPNPR